MYNESVFSQESMIILLVSRVLSVAMFLRVMLFRGRGTAGVAQHLYLCLSIYLSIYLSVLSCGSEACLNFPYRPAVY